MRHVLALDNDAPICAQCASAVGGTPRADINAAVVPTLCGLCHNIRLCRAVESYTWTATTIRPDPVPPRRVVGNNTPEAPRTAVCSDPTQGSQDPADARPEPGNQCAEAFYGEGEP